MFKPSLCLLHPEEELQSFCVTCETSVCDKCVVGQHNGHDCHLLDKALFQVSRVCAFVHT